MRKVKEVLRLRYELGMSYSQIRQSCGVSLGTLNNLLVRAEQAGLTGSVRSRGGLSRAPPADRFPGSF